MSALMQLTRREFLRRNATLAAATIGFPSLLPTGVLAADGQPGANDRINIGFVGIGRQASGLLQMLLGLKEARFMAVADLNLPRAEAAAKPHNAKVFKDYRKLLELKDVDAIVTATPDHWRSLVCIHACQAGKDIYAEKPMTLTIREGRLMVQAVRKYKRVFQTGSQQRSMWPNRAGCEMVRKGVIGKVTRVIAANYPSPWECGFSAEPIPAGLDWDMWCGPTELVPFNKDLYGPRANPGWISFRPYSGGEMTGWGAHGLDQVQCALGMDESGPLEIWTEGPKFDPPKYTTPESRARGDKVCGEPKIFYRYAGDIVMELGKGPMGGAIFVGEKAKLTIDRGVCKSDPADLADNALENHPKGLNENHIRNWLQCIKSREKPIADVEIGHRSTTVCHLGNIARWTGRRLRWDPVKEMFVGDAEANTYLDRPRRKGYEFPQTI
jgi:predicted dehydrogenase